MAYRLARRAFTTTRRAAQDGGHGYDRQLSKRFTSRLNPTPSSSTSPVPAPSSSQAREAQTHLGFRGIPSSSAATPPMPLRSFKPQKFAAPHDLSPTEMFAGPLAHRSKTPLLGPSRKQVHHTDPFLALGLDPLKECQNSKLYDDYLTDLGRIKSRNRTGLSWKNQRKLGQAVRRARCMGILPYWNDNKQESRQSP